MKRINHQKAYSLAGACTNWAEEFFSRMRRAEIGHRHHIAGPYLLRFAQEASWREDNCRLSNGEQISRVSVLDLGLSSGPPVLLPAPCKNGVTKLAVNFETKTPKKLLSEFKKAIDSGHVVTWAYDSDGDFYHTPDQWKDVGWLRPTIYEGQMLTLNFIARTSTKTTKVNYSVYHGRFIESMLAHCDVLFDAASATALPTNSDSVTAAA